MGYYTKIHYLSIERNGLYFIIIVSGIKNNLSFYGIWGAGVPCTLAEVKGEQPLRGLGQSPNIKESKELF